jgi:hypothetical protein
MKSCRELQGVARSYTELQIDRSGPLEAVARSYTELHGAATGVTTGVGGGGGGKFQGIPWSFMELRQEMRKKAATAPVARILPAAIANL